MLNGDLERLADRPPRGNVFGDVPVTWEAAGAGGLASFPQVYEASTIVARLLNGFTVVIFHGSSFASCDVRAQTTTRP